MRTNSKMLQRGKIARTKWGHSRIIRLTFYRFVKKKALIFLLVFCLRWEGSNSPSLLTFSVEIPGGQVERGVPFPEETVQVHEKFIKVVHLKW